MKRQPQKLKLSKETLRTLTDGTLLYVGGGLSGMNVPDGCGPTNWLDCPSFFVQYGCN
jgi:hypothetical protein